MEQNKFDLQQFSNAVKHIPFGHSGFQIENFISKKETPERAYRQIMLEMNDKLIALKQCEFRRKRIEIDIKELDIKIAISSGFEKQRAEVDLEEKLFTLSIENKLIEDAIIELNIYETLRKKFPQYTRQEFESSEYDYWKNRLLGEAKAQYLSSGRIDHGTLMTLEKINISVVKDEKNQLEVIIKPINQLESKI